MRRYSSYDRPHGTMSRNCMWTLFGPLPHRSGAGTHRPATSSSYRRPVTQAGDSGLASVEEGHVPQRTGLVLGVHQDPVPAVQRDRPVVGVPHTAPHIHLRVPAHRPPAPGLRLRLLHQQAVVLGPAEAVGEAAADVDRFAAGMVAEVTPVRLAAVAPGDR